MPNDAPSSPPPMPNPFGPPQPPKPPEPLELAYDPRSVVKPADGLPPGSQERDPDMTPHPGRVGRVVKAGPVVVVLLLLAASAVGVWLTLEPTARGDAARAVDDALGAVKGAARSTDEAPPTPACPSGAVWVYESRDGPGIVDRFHAIPTDARATARCRKL